MTRKISAIIASLFFCLAATPALAGVVEAPLKPCDPAALPRYTDFAIVPETIDARPTLKLDSTFARKYRTRLGEGLRDLPINFAGHYVMVTFGCGSTCLYGGMVDVRTGEATALPFPLDSFGPFGIEDPLLYRVDSRLVITFASATADETRPEASYYEWTDAELKPVCARILTDEDTEKLRVGSAPTPPNLQWPISQGGPL